MTLGFWRVSILEAHMSAHTSFGAYMSTQMSTQINAHISYWAQVSTYIFGSTILLANNHTFEFGSTYRLTYRLVCLLFPQDPIQYFQDRGKRCPRYTASNITYNPCDWCNGNCRINKTKKVWKWQNKWRYN